MVKTGGEVRNRRRGQPENMRNPGGEKRMDGCLIRNIEASQLVLEGEAVRFRLEESRWAVWWRVEIDQARLRWGQLPRASGIVQGGSDADAVG